MQAQPAEDKGVQRPLLTGPKRHHFLPQFYLEGFTQGGLVAVYDRELNEFRSQQPINTGVIGHFYTVQDADGRRRYEIEAMLSDFESKATPIVEKLADGKQIDDDERANLAIFVALAAMRTPDVIDSLKLFKEAHVLDTAKRLYTDVEDVAADMRQNPEYAGLSDETILEDARFMVDMAQNGGCKVEVDHTWAVKMAIDLAFKVAPLLAGRDWMVFIRECDKKSFITTDAPVVLTSEGTSADSFYGIGYGSADAIVLFPLTESSMLVMCGNGGNLKWIAANADTVRQLNLTVASRCQRFIVGRDESLLRSLAEYLGLASKKWQPKLQAR
ncbi:DUF4238 domain-containing protein [Chitinimonas sp. JJ19]|uniref:DUF4238 domain-containing protein n=1 Tax=Chitinimonas sp. JJ19 TaxID=3109352 RepID=UPI0030025AD7